MLSSPTLRVGSSLLLLLLHQRDVGAFVASPMRSFGRHAGTTSVFRGGNVVATSFDELTLDQKVAMVRVAKCLNSRGEDEPGAFAAKMPTVRDWDSPTNETWVAIRESYPVFGGLDDETLAQARDECLKMQAASSPGPAAEGGLASGAVPLALAAVAVAAGLFLNSPGVSNPGCGSTSLPQAAQRSCAEQAARASAA